MGQKVNPIAFRLGINRPWDSIWFAKKSEYGKFLIEDYKIRKFIKENIKNSGVSDIIIERSSKKCTVTIHTSRPGFVIGKKGSDIEKIKKKLSKLTSDLLDIVVLFGLINTLEKSSFIPFSILFIPKLSIRLIFKLN